ncbi:hypothetical protein EJB05_06596 [Eragrostis curvula]|uniref:DUF4005 domain-containing protein n=1 Tax=Eragrostis curvula TaxID=38414 RepID=A0A5J9WI42_9POAL|nr:hypothetical protein EJB05_06596 [Eragrostis curvula]
MEKEKRRRGWFERIKRLFTSEPKQKPNSKPEKKGKSKRWLPGKLRTQTSFALPAPAPETTAAEQVVMRQQAEDEQNKHAVAVALATQAAAEAAVAAAHAAAEVVRLTGHQQQQAPAPPSRHEQAAVEIQSAYRGYLARRALRALKGLVRLQALIRGQAVRRQTAATLRGLESLMKIQARNRGGGGRALNPFGTDEEDEDDLLLRRGRELYAAAVHEQQLQSGKGGGWDSSIFSKEEMSAMMRSREEAALKRVRALQYASIQNEKLGIRRPPVPTTRDEAEALNQRWSWLEEWVGSQPFDKDVPVAHQSPYRDPNQDAKARLACLAAADDADRLGCSARRSFVRPRRTPARGADPYCYDDSSAVPAFPGYMASTASAKAKFRSMSTPKERSCSGASDAYSEHCFPFADRMLSPIPSMSPIPSIASDMGFARSTRPPVAQRSPRVVKGPMTPARSRSRRSPSHHSFGSEAALHQMQMEHYTPVR